MATSQASCPSSCIRLGLFFIRYDAKNSTGSSGRSLTYMITLSLFLRIAHAVRTTVRRPFIKMGTTVDSKYCLTDIAWVLIFVSGLTVVAFCSDFIALMRSGGSYSGGFGVEGCGSLGSLDLGRSKGTPASTPPEASGIMSGLTSLI